MNLTSVQRFVALAHWSRVVRAANNEARRLGHDDDEDVVEEDFVHVE
jgi:hypothetical protein